VSIAWTTLLIIALLMPGISFFVGYWTRERYSHEIVNSTAVGEIGMAVFVATSIHLLAWWFLWCFWDFSPSFYFRPLSDYATAPPWLVLDQFFNRLWPSLIYLLATSIMGFVIGLATAWLVMFGLLRWLAAHPWAYDLIREGQLRGTVTAYVLTNITENNRTLKYSGHLEEFFLEKNGCFSYVVLKDCQRYYMIFDGDAPKTGPREKLFRIGNSTDKKFEHLFIDGKSIANILFDPSVGDFDATKKGTEALDAELDKFIQELLDERDRQNATVR
jgi:hypothetical protein